MFWFKYTSGVATDLQCAPACRLALPSRSSSGVQWGPGSENAHAYIYRPFISASAATVGSQCLAAKMGLCGAQRSESPKATGRIPPRPAAIRRFGSHRVLLKSALSTLMHYGVVMHALLSGVWGCFVFVLGRGDDAIARATFPAQDLDVVEKSGEQHATHLQTVKMKCEAFGELSETLGFIVFWVIWRCLGVHFSSFDKWNLVKSVENCSHLQKNGLWQYFVGLSSSKIERWCLKIPKTAFTMWSTDVSKVQFCHFIHPTTSNQAHMKDFLNTPNLL